MSKPVIVVGGGIGGLSAVIRLAAHGKKVILLDQNAQVGGKMGERKQAGFRWDTGPSVITMRWVLEDLFLTAGKRLEDYLTLIPIDPLTRYFYPDGSVFDATRDLVHMASQIAQFNQRDVEGYFAYLAYVARLHRITGPAFIYGPPPSLASFRSVSPIDIFQFDPLRKMSAAINSYVKSKQMRQFLGRFATYTGASPFLAPATLNVIAHVELIGGIWYPQGGIYAIASALEQMAIDLGVEIFTNHRVEQFLVKEKSVVGVKLTDGTVFEGEYVVANIDVSEAYSKLIPQGAISDPQRKKHTSRKLSCSGFVILLGVKGITNPLVHHNILFSSDYRREFFDIFSRGLPPEDPTIYIAITSKTDVDHAPPGCENWFVLVNVPPMNQNFNWSTQAHSYKLRIYEMLRRRGFDLTNRILVEQILTPNDLENLTGAFRGALYGASSNELFAAFQRPHNRCQDLKGLYFCGGTVHPGGGVPMVMLSAKSAVDFALAQ